MENKLMMFDGKDVEVFEFEGKVLFNPKHVGECLDIVGKTISNHMSEMDSDEVVKLTNNSISLLTGFRKLHNTGENFLTEEGVYALIFKSRKPSALKFQKWVTKEVLPAIRKNGGYIPVDENTTDDEIMARALIIAQNTIDNKNKVIKEMKPKVLSYETLMDSKGDLDFNQFVKSSDLIFGRNKFMDFLREEKILRQKPSTEPYQSYIDRGYFNVIQTVKNGVSYGKTVITKKGVDWLFNKCRSEWELTKA